MCTGGGQMGGLGQGMPQWGGPSNYSDGRGGMGGGGPMGDPRGPMRGGGPMYGYGAVDNKMGYMPGQGQMMQPQMQQLMQAMMGPMMMTNTSQVPQQAQGQIQPGWIRRY